MKRGAIGLVIVLVYGWLLAFGIRAASVDSSVGQGIAEIMSNHGQAIDPANWVKHWRVRGVFLACFGFFGILAGVTLLMQRHWGWLLLAIVSFAYLVYEWAVYASPFFTYAFEQPHVGRSVVLLAVVIGAFVAYRKSKEIQANVHNA